MDDAVGPGRLGGAVAERLAIDHHRVVLRQTMGQLARDDPDRAAAAAGIVHLVPRLGDHGDPHRVGLARRAGGVHGCTMQGTCGRWPLDHRSIDG